MSSNPDGSITANGVHYSRQQIEGKSVMQTGGRLYLNGILQGPEPPPNNGFTVTNKDGTKILYLPEPAGPSPPPSSPAPQPHDNRTWKDLTPTEQALYRENLVAREISKASGSGSSIPSTSEIIKSHAKEQELKAKASTSSSSSSPPPVSTEVATVPVRSSCSQCDMRIVTNRPMIACCKCNKWLHLSCAGFTRKVLAVTALAFQCLACKASHFSGRKGLQFRDPTGIKFKREDGGIIRVTETSWAKSGVVPTEGKDCCSKNGGAKVYECTGNDDNDNCGTLFCKHCGGEWGGTCKSCYNESEGKKDYDAEQEEARFKRITAPRKDAPATGGVRDPDDDTSDPTPKEIQEIKVAIKKQIQSFANKQRTDPKNIMKAYLYGIDFERQSRGKIIGTGKVVIAKGFFDALVQMTDDGSTLMDSGIELALDEEDTEWMVEWRKDRTAAVDKALSYILENFLNSDIPRMKVWSFTAPPMPLIGALHPQCGECGTLGDHDCPEAEGKGGGGSGGGEGKEKKTKNKKKPEKEEFEKYRACDQGFVGGGFHCIASAKRSVGHDLMLCDYHADQLVAKLAKQPDEETKNEKKGKKEVVKEITMEETKKKDPKTKVSSGKKKGTKRARRSGRY